MLISMYIEVTNKPTSLVSLMYCMKHLVILLLLVTAKIIPRIPIVKSTLLYGHHLRLG